MKKLWIFIPALILISLWAWEWTIITAQTIPEQNNSSLDGTPPTYDIEVIEHGSSALGNVHEFSIIDLKGNFITCIVLEDKLSCYINNDVIPN